LREGKPLHPLTRFYAGRSLVTFTSQELAGRAAGALPHPGARGTAFSHTSRCGPGVPLQPQSGGRACLGMKAFGLAGGVRPGAPRPGVTAPSQRRTVETWVAAFLTAGAWVAKSARSWRRNG